MQNIQVTTTVEINLTPNQWQLYTASRDCSVAASILNNTWNKNQDKSRSELEELMSDAMWRWEEYGAADSEPYWVLENLLDQKFGKESSHY